MNSSLKLVGDRYALTARQRLAVQRSSCTDSARKARAERCIEPAMVRGRPLSVDGYNLLITIESALAGGVILVGRDGGCCDLASIHGTYRAVQETAPATSLIFEAVAAIGPTRVDWYLDRPVSNSARLKVLMATVIEERGMPEPWNIELVDSPDRVLTGYAGIVVTSDSVILNGCVHWTNLASAIIERSVPQAWIVDLGYRHL